MAVQAPADKRFRRAHVTPARRRSWLPRPTVPMVARAVALVAVLLIGGYKAIDMALSAEALTISRISVEGNSRMSRGEVLALLEGLNGQHMVAVDLEEWRGKLLTSPWVEDAAVRRMLPGSVAVQIVEREPLAIGRIGDRLYLVDRDGNVIDEYGPNYASLDLPIIDGLEAANTAGGLLIDASRAALAARVLAALQARPDLAGRVSQIDVSDVHDAVVLLKGDTAYVRIGEEQFVERMQSYLDIAPVLREQVPDIDYVDLRFDERVYVRPQGSGRAGRLQPARLEGN
ncbi:MAG: cell division protein FtsQ/DivIB [Vicinamibacterales bacterium]